MDLKTYLAQERGAQAQLCRQIGAHAPDVSRWADGTRQIPVDRCVAIERATGNAVRRWDLRPLDWHLIWPELIGTKGAPRARAALEG